jgi:hypothetical protein
MKRLWLVLILAFPALAQESLPPIGPQVDYPASEWFPNIGHRLDGAGMCVFTSIEFSARWSNLEEFRGFRDWCANHTSANPQFRGGGGYPEKVDYLLTEYCKAKKIREPRFYQYQGSDPAVLDKVMQRGQMACVTLFSSKRYPQPRIYHMVCCIHCDKKVMALLDNNQMKGEGIPPIEVAGREETLRRIKLNGEYWAFWWDAPGPPPCPKNKR